MRASEELLADLEEIRSLVHGFAHRDRGQWEQLAALYAPDAVVAISWFQGRAKDFVASCEEARKGGQVASVKHVLGHPRITVSGDRAIADTDVVILMRAPLGPNRDLVDITSWCRFFQFIEKRGDRWQIGYWTAVYEKDRFDAVHPGCALEFVIDAEKLKGLPNEFQSLAYVLHETGQVTKDTAIVAFSPEEEKLERIGSEWLSGNVDVQGVSQLLLGESATVL